MSVSTTTTVPVGVNELLRAYELHHSGNETTQSQYVETSTQASRQLENPPSWPSNRRRMPAYREASRSHRLADRPAGETTTEGVINTVMFLGVYVNSIGLKLWKHTGARINDRIFRYEVGGER